jgi:hypothetical protein
VAVKKVVEKWGNFKKFGYFKGGMMGPEYRGFLGLVIQVFVLIVL